MDQGISWSSSLKTDKSDSTRSDTEALDGKGLSCFLQRTLGGDRRETHRGSPSTQRAQRAQELRALPTSQSERGGFAEEITSPLIMHFPEICFWSQGQDMGDWDVVQPGTSALSHSCNPQADVKQLQQGQPWQCLCSSPQLHCFSPCFCGTGVGGLCQHRCCPDASAVRETPGNRFPIFIHLWYAKLRRHPSTSAVSFIQQNLNCFLHSPTLTAQMEQLYWHMHGF